MQASNCCQKWTIIHKSPAPPALFLPFSEIQLDRGKRVKGEKKQREVREIPAHPPNRKDTMHEFDQFLTGLRADARLGRYIPAPTPYQTAEAVILSLAIALANATEGTRGIHPAFALLEELDAAEVRR